MYYLGYNYRLTDFQAALGISQMKKIDFFLKKRKEIVKFYNKKLNSIKNIILPYEKNNFISNFHLYVIQVKNNNKYNRYELFKYLRKKKILTQVHYIPIHYLKFYKKKYNFKKGDFPNVEKYYDQALSLPLYPGLSTKELNRVVKTVKDYFE